MRLLISLWFITFCVALLINEQNALYSPKSDTLHVKNHPLKPDPEQVLFREDTDESQTECQDSPVVASKVPTISDIISTDNIPVLMDKYEFDWAGFNREFIDDFDKKRKRSSPNNHVTGDFDKGYLKHVHLYPPSCACQTKFRLFDLGHNTFPRYLLNAVCINRHEDSRNCWHGSKCKEIPYIVRVLTQRNIEDESIQDDEMANLLPHDLKYSWKFKNVKVSAACQCAI